MPGPYVFSHMFQVSLIHDTADDSRNPTNHITGFSRNPQWCATKCLLPSLILCFFHLKIRGSLSRDVFLRVGFARNSSPTVNPHSESKTGQPVVQRKNSKKTTGFSQTFQPPQSFLSQHVPFWTKKSRCFWTPKVEPGPRFFVNLREVPAMVSPPNRPRERASVFPHLKILQGALWNWLRWSFRETGELDDTLVPSGPIVAYWIDLFFREIPMKMWKIKKHPPKLRSWCYKLIQILYRIIYVI